MGAIFGAEEVKEPTVETYTPPDPAEPTPPALQLKEMASAKTSTTKTKKKGRDRLKIGLTKKAAVGLNAGSTSARSGLVISG